MKTKKWTIFTVCFLFLIFVQTSAYAKVWYVDSDVAISGSGETWTDSFKTIQEAVTIANEATDDEIWVKKGTYTLSNQISITKKLAIYGGFEGAETRRDLRNWKNNVTMVNGENSTRCFYISLSTIIDKPCTIDGFTVKNGNTSGDGGGLYGNGDSISIKNCIFTGNTADSDGGGIAFYNVPYGLISNCSFLDNNASQYGGAAYIKNSYHPTVESSTFYNNRAVSSGGGIFFRDNYYPYVKNSTFCGNFASSGGGIYLYARSSPPDIILYSSYIRNCTLYNNNAENSGGGIRIYHYSYDPTDTGYVTIKNCILWENKINTLSMPELNQIDSYDVTLTVAHCDVQGGHEGLGNIVANPVFVDADGSDDIPETYEDNDYHLSPESFCVDAGSDDIDLSERDKDGKPRVLDGDEDGELIVDMGAFEYGPCILVTSPNGGESWHDGSLHEITWVYDNAGDSVRIEISRNGGETWASITDSTENDGSYDWTVTTPLSDACLIRIVSVEFPNLEDVSDANVTIDPPLITLKNPNGGEYYIEGESLNIIWSSEGGEFVKIEISRDGGETWTNITDNTENDGSYDWTITEPMSAVCRIRIGFIDYPLIIDSSDADFTISSRYIIVISPDGSECLIERDTLHIAWTAHEAGEFVKIEISRDGGMTWGSITDNTENDGSYDWTVTEPASAACRVRVTSIDYPSVTGSNDDDFTIVPAYLMILSPNGGEYWSETDSRLISWAFGNAGEFVSIEISRDAGASWNSITGSTENDGIFDWAATGPLSDFCRIRISSIDYPSIFDTSDSDFIIVEYDSDGDGMMDSWEMEVFQNLERDGSLDWDDDGLNDAGEFENHTDPKDSDTDDDGMPDGWEVNNGLDPLTNDADVDADGDGYSNYREYIAKTNPGDESSKPLPMIIHVDVDNTTGIEDGTKANPFDTIQEAVNFSGDAIGEEIWVRQGTYLLSSAVIVDKKIGIYGGFAGWEYERHQRDWKSNVTTVDGNSADRCFFVSSPVIIDGLTITNGETTENGGGICTSRNLTVDHCTFLSNNAGEDGGAVYVGYISDYIITTITNCIFLENTAGSGGGAFSFRGHYGLAKITNCLFFKNLSGTSGGGLYLSLWGYSYITNCTFTDNSAAISAGGMYFSAPSDRIFQLQNNIVWNNHAANDPQIARYSVTVSVSYSDVEGGYAGEENLDTEPFFIDPENHDFHLQSNSPCIDSGTNDATDLTGLDRDGMVRVIDGDGIGEAVVDMGAFEYGSYLPMAPPELITPNGGEYWDEDDAPHYITWAVGNAGPFVEIDISRDSGATWSTILENTENDGDYLWNITPPVSTTCRIKIISTTEPSLEDSSDTDFIINLDSEADGMKDLWEMEHFGNLDRDGTQDWDADGLSDKGEYDNNTDPRDWDSDDDLIRDGWEVNNDLDPLLDDALEDPDVDGYCNYREYTEETDPNDSDSIPSSTIIHVDGANVTGVEDGSTKNPFDTIQEAINFAGDNVGEEIWVRAGTYLLLSTLQVNKTFGIYGGFNGSETAREERDWQNNSVIISGGGISITSFAAIDGFTFSNGYGMYIDAPGSSSSFPVTIGNSNFFNNNRAIFNFNTAVIITDCVFTGNLSEGNGGAIKNYYAWIDLKNCTFYNNSAGGYEGGAIKNFKSSGTIYGCLFEENAAGINGGGAIMNVSCSPSILNCTFLNNHTTWGGGAINNSSNAFNLSDPGSAPTITNCIFSGNRADYVGGAIWNWNYSSPTITNCIFAGNETNGSAEDGSGVGGAISSSESAPIVTNCTFFGNKATVKGGAIYNGGTTYFNESPVIYNCIFSGDSAPEESEISNSNSYPTVRYCDVEGGYAGTGNLNSDPLFADPDGPDDDLETCEDNDFRLQADSECMDRGYNSAPELPLADLDGKSRKIDGDNNGSYTVDMGAYEFGALYPGDFDGDGDLDGSDLATLAAHQHLLDIYSFAGSFGMEGCGQ